MKFGEVFDNILKTALNKLSPSETLLWLVILYHARRADYKPVAISRDELASQLATSTKTIQRAIKKLEQIGAIEVERRLKLPSKYKIISKAFKGDIKGDMTADLRGTSRGTSRGTRPPNVPPSTNLASTRLVNTKLNHTKLARVGHASGNSSRSVQEPSQIENPKKLSMWVLKGRKEACETELKEIRGRGNEYAMGFEYDSKNDQLRARELKKTIKELNRKMQNADS